MPDVAFLLLEPCETLLMQRHTAGTPVSRSVLWEWLGVVVFYELLLNYVEIMAVYSIKRKTA